MTDNSHVSLLNHLGGFLRIKTDKREHTNALLSTTQLPLTDSELKYVEFDIETTSASVRVELQNDALATPKPPAEKLHA